MKKRISKAKSQELPTDTAEPLESVSPPLSPVSTTAAATSSGTGIMSKMKKVLGSYGSSPLERRRAQSLNTLNQVPTFGVELDSLLESSSPKTRKISLQHPSPSSSPRVTAAATSTSSPGSNRQIPHIVSKIIEHIEAQGLRQEGIYRVNGNARVMEALKNSFDRTGDADFHEKDIFSVAGLLKLFLRQLPTSLIPEKHIDHIVEINETTQGDEQLHQLCVLLKKLPKTHFHLLQALCKHLLTLSQFSDDNKMTPVSLSIVFGPSVLKCGGGLGGLKKQGSANAAFTRMIQNYDIVFEDDSLSLDILQQQSPNGSFETRFKKVRRRPNKPEPYKKHIEHKAMQRATAAVTPSTSDNDSPQKNEMDEAIDEAFEAVIREDIEANERKQHRKSEGWLATPITISSGNSVGKPKPLFHSEDLSTRVSSPYSWKSSTNSSGTSPTTSPAITPRSSQVITTLIGDTINDHLFETQTVTTTIPSNSSSKHVHTVASGGLGVATSPSITSSSSFQFNGDVRSDSSTEGTGMRPAGTSTDGSTGLRSGSSTESRSGTDGTRLRSGSSTEDIAEHQTSRVKQLQKDLDLSSVVKRSSASRGSRYRKSAVYGETIVTNTEGQDDGGSNRGGVSVLARQLEGKMKGIDVKQQDEKGDGATPESLIEKSQDERSPSEGAPPTSLSTVNEPSMTDEVPEKEEQPAEKEFDNVQRTSRILNHPTLQRVRIPMKRAKPSRRSMILKKERDNNDQQDGLSNANPSSDIVPDSRTLEPKNRNVSVSSITSVTSKISSLSTPRSSEPEVISGLSQVTTPTLMETIVDTEEHQEKKSEDQNGGVAPEDRPGVTKAWSKIDTVVKDGETVTIDTADMDKMSFEELLRLAQKVRTRIREYEAQFTKKHGRKPSTKEQTPVGEQIRVLSIIKKKLKEIKLSENRTSKTAPVLQLENTKDYEDDLTTQSTMNIDEAPKSTATVSRHKSLHVAPSADKRKPLSIDLVTICREMQVTLLERCAKEGRPHDLNMMTYEQLLNEKQVLQKLLLGFERKHGRPQTSEDKDVMRPIYNRYREIKRQLANYGGSKKKQSSSNFTLSGGMGSPDEGDTLGSVTILQSQTLPTADMKPSVSSSSVGGLPSSFVLPISSPERQSHKHIKLRKHTSVTTTTTVSSISSSVRGGGGVSISSTSSTAGEGRSSLGHMTNGDKSTAVNSNDTNIDLMKTSTSELKIQLMLEQSRRKELRKELRTFEREFEQKYKRQLTKEDKKPKTEQYLEYRMVKSKISEITDVINSRTSLHSTT